MTNIAWKKWNITNRPVDVNPFDERGNVDVFRQELGKISLKNREIYDFDNDNDFDLYLSNWGINRLFRNDGNTFLDVTSTYNVYSDSFLINLSGSPHEFGRSSTTKIPNLSAQYNFLGTSNFICTLIPFNPIDLLLRISSFINLSVGNV